MSEATSVRADVWLWRARFFKTRTLAAKVLDDGKIRLTRAGQETRIDKCARPVKVGDRLGFAFAGRLAAVTVVALGDRRGPPEAARALYAKLDLDPA